MIEVILRRNSLDVYDTLSYNCDYESWNIKFKDWMK